MGNTDTITVQATATSLRIVEELYERDGGGVTELAGTLDVSKSAVHNHLSTLCALGYVKNSGGTYELTHRFLRIGFGTRERNPVYQAAQRRIRMLARNTSAVANLVVPEEANAVYLHRIGARNHPIPVGGSVRLHAAAAGKGDPRVSVRGRGRRVRHPPWTRPEDQSDRDRPGNAPL